MFKIEKTFTSETKPGLRLNFTSENVGVKINGGQEDKSVLELKIDYKTKSGNELDVSEFLKLEYNADENEMNITFHEPKDLKLVKAKIELTVPESTKVKAETENGPLGVFSLTGDQIIKTENGPVAIRNIEGNIQFESENGPLEAIKINGDIGVTVENSPITIKETVGNCQIGGENGIIKIKNSSGNLQINNENGQIRVLDSGYNSAEIKNQNGGIYYEFNTLEEGAFNFKNQNGKIRLIIPEDVQCNLTAENSLGKINVGIEGNYDKQKINGKTQIQLVKGSGRVKIKAANENGSINISKSREKEKDKHTFDFNFNGLAGSLDEVMSNIPEEDREKVKKKLEKIKLKFNNIDFDKLEKKIDAAAQKFEKAVEKEFDLEKTTEIMDKVKVGLNKAMEKLNSKNDDSDEIIEKSNKNEESKLMILKMLQDGKITSEEAEKLLKAIGE